MRFTTILTASALTLAIASPAWAADKKIDRILNFARVTSDHKILNNMNGSWRGTGSLINAEGGAAEKILCKSTNKLILGDRFLEQKTTCKGAGFSFNGVGFFGFDVLSGRYVGSSMSEVDSGISTLKGSRKGDTITFDIVHNNVDVKKRVTSRATLSINAKNHTYEVWAKDKSGALKPIFSVTYNR